MSDLTSGQVLSAAREAAGLSLREVADALNLQIHTLEAIEQDAADRLPADVFTRGYIRAYAKYLGLESGPWTQAPVAPPPPVEQPNAQPKRRFAIEQNHLIGGALGLVIIIVLAIWLFSDSSDDTPPAVNNEEIAGAGVAPAARETGAAERTGAARETGAAGETVAAVETTTGETVAAGEMVAAGQDGENFGAGPAMAQAEVDEPGTAQVAAAAENLVPVTGTQQPAANPTLTGGVPERRLTEGGDEVLAFEFTDECWVEIKNSRNEVLYANLGRPGARWRFVGAGPFQLLLGYAAGVTLTYNDELIALVPHTRNNVARLVLGQ